MKLSTALLFVCLVDCHAQEKKKSTAKPTESPVSPWVYKQVAEDEACTSSGSLADSWASSDGTSGVADDKRKISWTIPESQRWDCRDGHWRRDLDKEAKERKHKESVDAVRAIITDRKLTAQELPLAPEAATIWPSGGVSYLSPGESSGCRESARANATLIAQLSFWNPKEDELPLALMMEYVKGAAVCGEAAQQAYRIMNSRIMAWLMKQEQR